MPSTSSVVIRRGARSGELADAGRLLGRSILVAASILALGPIATSASAQQTTDQLFAGDSVRINGTVVGRVLEIDGPMLTVVSHGQPRCVAGLLHGDAPICNPAPIIRREWTLSSVEVERRMRKGNMGVRTVVGGLVGAAAFGTAGYFIGPAVSFGRITNCQNSNASHCEGFESRTPEEIAADQKRQDQIKGVIFFGVIGGTFTAIMARKLSVGWVRVEPSVPLQPSDPWQVSFSVPTAR